MRGLSVTTWLIVICVAVFFVDMALPGRVVEMGRIVPTVDVNQFPASYHVEPKNFVGPSGGQRIDAPTQLRPAADNLDPRRFIHIWRPVLDRPGGQQVGWMLCSNMHFLESFLHFSTARGFQRLEFWRLIGFQFLHTHVTIIHLLFNMVGLYFFGPLAEQYLGGKRFLAFYLLCGICGALLYSLLNLGGYVVDQMGGPMIPGLLFNDTSTPLVGASAGVFGVLMAGAFLAPRATVLLFFILPMQLRTLAYALVVVSILSLLFGANNAGGEAGHLGGALAGYYFIRNPHHLHGFFDFLGRADPTSHHYRGSSTSRRSRPLDPVATAEIDRILDKIRTGGTSSLTDKERKMLRDASRQED